MTGNRPPDHLLKQLRVTSEVVNGGPGLGRWPDRVASRPGKVCDEVYSNVPWITQFEKGSGFPAAGEKKGSGPGRGQDSCCQGVSTPKMNMTESLRDPGTRGCSADVLHHLEQPRKLGDFHRGASAAPLPGLPEQPGALCKAKGLQGKPLQAPLPRGWQRATTAESRVLSTLV